MSAGPNLKGSKRALRRHHVARRKRWVERNLRHYFPDSSEPEPRRVGLYAETPAACSCWMCGNPRKYFGELSIQEQRAIGWPSLTASDGQPGDQALQTREAPRETL